MHKILEKILGWQWTDLEVFKVPQGELINLVISKTSANIAYCCLHLQLLPGKTITMHTTATTTTTIITMTTTTS